MALRKSPKPSLPGRRAPRQTKASKSSDKKKEKKENLEKVSQETQIKDDSKMTLCTVATLEARVPRRPGRPPTVKSCSGSARQRDSPTKLRSSFKRSFDPCDNSNDSGLGFGDHQMDHHQHRLAVEQRITWTGERAAAKRQKIDVKLENEEINDGYSFPENVRTSKDQHPMIRTIPTGPMSSLSMPTSTNNTSVKTVAGKQPSIGFPSLNTQLLSSSRYSNASLQILKQPEQQHRARYQTEGSRGAVKDRDGNSFPIVKLVNYFKPATLQVFIGTDTGRITPHMFYQACKVSGKNSTPCIEKNVDGTCVIELQLEPSKEMCATCDCVGILKERNVDVEHRFPDQLGSRCKKKSTKCRMVFRTTLTFDDGTQETLQVSSHPIVCTQPPGIPEICKKSLTSCPATGGLELFVLGKNFLKDTKVIFQQCEEDLIRWEQTVIPDKEYLQQTHFVCVVPPYRRPDIIEPVLVRLSVLSSGKHSETHQFVYTPVNGVPSVLMENAPPRHQPPTFFKSNFWQSNVSISKREQDLDMMPPPESSMVPISTRRPSINMSSSCDNSLSPPLHHHQMLHQQHSLKQEYIDESSQNSLIDQDRYHHLSESSLDVHHGDSNMSMINENSMMSHLNENSNISVGNEENSIDVVRDGCLNRLNNMCESSMDCGNSNMSINEDSTCSTALTPHPPLPPLPPLPPPPPPPPVDQNTSSNAGMEKVMDLRMKMPLVTVADLVSTTAQSIAALQRFGIMEHPAAPLPNQSGQSVESYLNRIEAKPSVIPLSNPTGLLMKNDISQLITPKETIFTESKSSMQDCGLLQVGEPTFPASMRPFMSSRIQNEVINIVAKSESAVVPDHSLPEQTNTMAASSTITTVATALDGTVSTPINTDRLDAFVNSTVESHLSPTRSDSSPKDMLINNLVTGSPAEVMIPTQDVMLNSQSTLMVPSMINTSAQPELVATPSPNLTSEVILNSQLSPSLMCRTSNALQQENLMTSSPNISLCQTSNVVEQTFANAASPQQTLLSTSSQPELAVALTSEQEKVVLLNAAVDLLETQQKLNDFGTNLPSPNGGQLTTQANGFVQTYESIQNEKAKTQTVDRMIPQNFTSLTENELINFINPSCFDQV